MRVSEAWLREWVDPPVATEELASQLTMAGLEVGGVAPAAPPFEGVVLGRVTAADQHPNADKLRVCTVSLGDGEEQIVCGASNVAAGQLVAVARVGAKLPGGLKIRKAKLRGVESRGMICSGKELGLSEESEGILVLPEGGEPGVDVRDYLALDDQVIEVELTPNRGDCLGMAGIAREVGVINRLDVCRPVVEPQPAQNSARVAVSLEDGEGCPVYAGRVIRGIDNTATTPLWMQERLRRAGIRPISPIVDVTQYVMLESGQPMHGFDLNLLRGGIVVRRGRPGEKVTLLDGREVVVDDQVLVIADDSGARALAGIMGGADSGVSNETVDVFFEAAFFDPLVIAGRARRFGLHTDASFRFERGVAPGNQLTAIERATGLLLDIAGGEPGPAEQVTSEAFSTRREPVNLRRRQLHRVLGVEIDDDQVTEILTRLEMKVRNTDRGWAATPPAFRFDIEIEADLVEEVARIYGYNLIPEIDSTEQLPVMPDTESRVPMTAVESLLVSRGFREAVTYSFIDPALHEMLFPGVEGLALSNPISSELSCMRTSLLPGLLHALKQNVSRQRDRVRLFESGLRYVLQDNDLKQEKCVAGLIYGDIAPEQWAQRAREVDFFDLKGEVEALLALTGEPERFRFEPAAHPVLHPGQAAAILRDGETVGWAGALHPAHQRVLDLPKTPFLFEILVQGVFRAKMPGYGEISRFPSVRRDISLFVEESISAATLLECARQHAPKVLRQVFVFDVYRDSGIDSGLKSVALGLILQDYCSTLTDGEADATVDAVKAALIEDLKVKIRD